MTQPPPLPTRELFTIITPRYDRLNRILSFGMDLSWRRRLVAMVPKRGPILDIACGSGDLTLLLQKEGETVVGLDPVIPMLLAARQKGVDRLVCGQGEALPFRKGTFRLASAAFGIRNFADLPAHFAEMARCLTPGGVYGILEFSLPKRFPMRQLFALYRRIFPLIGALLTRSGAAYRHLANSIARYATIDTTSLAGHAGFSLEQSQDAWSGIITFTILQKGETDEIPQR